MNAHIALIKHYEQLRGELLMKTLRREIAGLLLAGMLLIGGTVVAESLDYDFWSMRVTPREVLPTRPIEDS